ncbi:MAG: SDR family oxidoreductase [Bacillota bacterium]|nr:SDR family oxidoreductase [Bacillota bacterium]
MRLVNKVAVITGAGSGMGRASAIRFAQEGAKVVVADLNVDNGQDTVDAIKKNGHEAVFIRVDVANEENVKEMVKTAVDNFGKLSIVFNVAGCPQATKPFETISNEEWDRIMNVNVKSIFYSAKHALEELKKEQGVILNVASVGGELPRPGSVCYATSKGAVINMTRALAIELAKYKIRVCNINPGPTDTPMMNQFIPGFNEEIKKTISAGTPLGSFVLPEDIASAAVFLASDEASKITGSALFVDSGLRIGRGEV